MARILRKSDEDLEEMLKELKIGQTILDTETGYDICKVPNGFIYKNEYIGMCFVPEVEAVGSIKNSIAKTEPKKAVTK